MTRQQYRFDIFFVPLLAVATALILTAIYVVFLRAPVEAHMGIVQKIFYFHVPSAYAMYLGASACFLGSAGYLLKPTDARDAFARAGAEVAIVFGAIVLVTGPLWAAKAWGYFWTWDPRLTTAMLSWLVYVAYVVLRIFAGNGPGERRFAAALGIIGAANLPIIHFSVQKWGGQHPIVVGHGGGGLAHPDMKIGFGLGMLSFTFFSMALLWTRTRLEIVKSRLMRAEQEAIDLGLDDRTEA
ncbi:MAG: cytochrome c biogenesis protein [Polyangiaceae bacterium]|nr:cytochrome c biogenesis protein [Polyangiaceae bacterium]